MFNNNSNQNDKNNKVENLLNSASKYLGKDPQSLKESMQNGNIAQSLSNLNSEDAAKIKETLISIGCEMLEERARRLGRPSAIWCTSPLLSGKQLCRVVLGIHLPDGIDDDTVFVNDIGGAECAFGHFAVHLLLAPSLVCFQDSEVGVGDEVERQFVFGDEILVRLGTIATDTQHVISQ